MEKNLKNDQKMQNESAYSSDPNAKNVQSGGEIVEKVQSSDGIQYDLMVMGRTDDMFLYFPPGKLRIRINNGILMLKERHFCPKKHEKLAKWAQTNFDK